MIKLGLIGYPLTHSGSKILHPIIANLYERKIKYSFYSLEDESMIIPLIDKLRLGKIKGLNVTIPYKEKIIKYIDELTPRAKDIGAVNTIYFENNKVVGDNTDYDGFKGLLSINNIKIKNNTAIILGSGGASKAVFKVLKDLNVKTKVVSRTKRLDSYFGELLSYDDLEGLEFDIIINTTPVGMYPNINYSPLGEEMVKDKLVIDLIYNPKTTKLMSYSNRSYNGLDMLIIQAIKAQDKWFKSDVLLNLNQIEEIRGKYNEQFRNII